MTWQDEMMKEVIQRIADDVETTILDWAGEPLEVLVRQSVGSEMRRLIQQIAHVYVKEKERSIISKLTPRVYSTLDAALDTIVKEIENGK